MNPAAISGDDDAQDSTNESDEEPYREHPNNDFLSSTDEDEDREIWNDVLPDELQKDLPGLDHPQPLPRPEIRSKSVAHSLVFWLEYFLLVWQVSVHISDNGMAWLLKFLSGWLKLLGLEVTNDVYSQVILAFPASTYMLREFLNFDRDNFDKYVVCQKCHKLYNYNECLTKVRNHEVGKTCVNTWLRKGRQVMCGASLVYRVQHANGKY